MHILPFNCVIKLTYPGICPGYIHVSILHVCILTRMHEDMLFIGGVCDTLGNSGFQVNWCHLGN